MGPRFYNDLTPQMRREREQQLVDLRLEVLQLVAENDGTLTQANRDHIARRAQKIVGNR
jgi:hypothetical protein